MREIAFLTSAGTKDPLPDDGLAAGPLATRGYRVRAVDWRAQEDWNRFHAVLPRSTWDYHLHLDDFLGVLEKVDASTSKLLNPFEALRWNADKRYLGELENAGVPVVPTSYGRALDRVAIEDLARQFGTDDLVVKPAVSASAESTFRVRGGILGAAAALDGRPWLAQPFMGAIVEEGEYSLVFFDGVFSHALLKRPRAGEFRVQEHHGGRNEPVRPEPALLASAGAVLSALPRGLLYARIDLVRHGGGFLLMEAELIEPSLYLGLDAAAPLRFADALAARLDRGA